MSVPSPDDVVNGKLLHDAVNLIDLARDDCNEVLRAMPNASLFTVVDLVTALGYLRQASVLTDKVADVLGTAAVR